MRTVRITLIPKAPYIMHHDNIVWADQMTAWEKKKENKDQSKAGDDRTPPYRWVGCLYHDTRHVVLPTDNIMSGLRVAGARTPTGKGMKTFKAQTQSGILAPDVYWEFRCRGELIPVANLLREMEAYTWEAHNRFAADHGFMLFVKRARVNGRKHIRVRPRFDEWSVSGSLIVADTAFTDEVLQSIGDEFGTKVGLGDWRPGAPQSPGPFGLFKWRME